MDEPLAPRANPDLFGQDVAAAQLRDAAIGGRPHHAWLISGPMGVGKATLAWRFARWLLAGMPGTDPGQAPLYLSPQHPAFARVAAGTHADIRLLAPLVADGKKKSQIGVEEARALPRFLAMTPAEGGWRAVIVDEADRMHPSAANALLKTLEEPPPRTALLLLSDAPARLLPTIRSRCRSLLLRPVEDTAIEQVLTSWWPSMSEDERRTLVRIARGSPGRALRMAEGEGVVLAREVEGVLATVARPDHREWHAVAERMASKRDGSAFVGFMELLRDSLADALRKEARGTPPAWFSTRTVPEWADAWGELGRLSERTEKLNLDRKQGVLDALAELSGR